MPHGNPKRFCEHAKEQSITNNASALARLESLPLSIDNRLFAILALRARESLSLSASLAWGRRHSALQNGGIG